MEMKSSLTSEEAGRQTENTRNHCKMMCLFEVRYTRLSSKCTLHENLVMDSASYFEWGTLQGGNFDLETVFVFRVRDQLVLCG